MSTASTAYSYGHHSIASAPPAGGATTTGMSSISGDNGTRPPPPPGFSALLHRTQHRRSSRTTLFSPTKSIRSRYNDTHFVDTEDAASLPNFPTYARGADIRGATTSNANTATSDTTASNTTMQRPAPLPTIRRTSSHTSDVLYSSDRLQEELRVEEQNRKILGPKRRQWVFVVGDQQQPPSSS